MGDVMRFYFDEKRAAQAAAWLLRRHGEPMESAKLVALLYLVDRSIFIESTYPLTGDEFVAAADGPTLRILRELTMGRPCSAGDLWKRYVRRVDEDRLAYTEVDEVGALSERDCKRLDEILGRYRTTSYRELSELNRCLPEWRAPADAPEPIDPVLVLRNAGYEEIDIEEATELVGSVHWLRTLLRS